MRLDPYDPVVAFDDHYDREEREGRAPAGGDALAAARRVIARVRGARIDLPTRVSILGCAGETLGFFLPLVPILGADEAPRGHTPLFSKLRRFFRAAMPEPRVVRVDDESSYADFRAARRASYCENLDARLAALEEALREHVSDGHGLRSRGDVEIVGNVEDDYGNDFEAARVAAVREAAVGGTRIPVARDLRGRVECWQDGEEILCTVRVELPGGSAFATSATPASRRVDEVIDCAGADLEEVLPAVPALAQVLGAEAVLRDLAGTLREVFRKVRRIPQVASVTPDGDPTLAAAMALLQACQRGDRRARGEVARMCAGGEGEILQEALDRLVRAQEKKARHA